jgi:hypothetical protein
MSNETKVTAVEWLVSKVNKQSWGDFRIDIPKEIIDQALTMEKQQIIDAWIDGEGYDDIAATPIAEQYYTDTYKP